MLADVSDSSVQLAALATLVSPLTHMDFHVFLQQVARQKLLVTQCALEGLVTCIKRENS